MFKAIIRTAALVALVLVLARFVPFVAEHEMALIIAAVALGLIGIIGRIFLLLLIAAAVVLLFHPFF